VLQEKVISRLELIDLFKKDKIQDTDQGWIMDNNIIDIIAIHSIEPKYLQDITRADFYKLVKKYPLGNAPKPKRSYI